jgi:hypothetical protein
MYADTDTDTNTDNDTDTTHPPMLPTHTSHADSAAWPVSLI